MFAFARKNNERTLEALVCHLFAPARRPSIDFYLPVDGGPFLDLAQLRFLRHEMRSRTESIVKPVPFAIDRHEIRICPN